MVAVGKQCLEPLGSSAVARGGDAVNTAAEDEVEVPEAEEQKEELS